jgi:probable metal-binding protein
MNPSATAPAQPAPTSIHGHEVIAMIYESKQAYTRESLAAAIVARFGADTRFFTCSAEGMTAPELVTFLEERGKFMPMDGGFTINPARVCQH